MHIRAIVLVHNIYITQLSPTCLRENMRRLRDPP